MMLASFAIPTRERSEPGGICFLRDVTAPYPHRRNPQPPSDI